MLQISYTAILATVTLIVSTDAQRMARDTLQKVNLDHMSSHVDILYLTDEQAVSKVVNNIACGQQSCQYISPISLEKEISRVLFKYDVKMSMSRASIFF